MGWGTGLGLASAYGIVKAHGGFISVYSKKGHGSTFNIYLLAGKSISKSERPDIDDQSLQRGTETILLVDDEPNILQVGKELLGALGYRVLAAAGGHEALDVFNKRSDEIDIIVLDVIMPEMDGGQVFRRVREIRPDMRVRLSSGYTADVLATEFLEDGYHGFIQKPFTLRELSVKIREILDRQ